MKRRPRRKRRSSTSSSPLIQSPLTAETEISHYDKNRKDNWPKPNAALMKPVQPDDALAVIVGSTPLPRGELTKKLWDYIKKNKLQDEKKRTLINADDALKVVFGGEKQVSMFEMTKLVSGHVK
jgi:chromatin remodeling complex protein RSC6